MTTEFSRTELLLGEGALRRLGAARVAVFGVGGVGGYVCEALARSGVGAFELVDADLVSLSNINRQIIATHRSVGRSKVEVMAERIADINSEADVRIRRCFFLPENAGEFHFEEYDYVVDAVDTVTAKLEIVMRAKAAGVPVISSMGAGNKLDPGAFRIADLYQTKVCPLAKVMRRELKKRGVERLKVVYSEEVPRVPGTAGLKSAGGQTDAEAETAAGTETVVRAQNAAAPAIEPEPALAPPPRRVTPGSVAFVPSVAGLMIAAEVIRDLSGAW